MLLPAATLQVARAEPAAGEARSMRMKLLGFRLALILGGLLLGVGVGAIALRTQLVQRLMRPALLDYMAANLDEQSRNELYHELAQREGTLWDIVPDALVGRLAKRNGEFRYKQAVVRTNNAGLRSALPYAPKPPDVFRIVCLGDSMVFGEGGLEEDRFCDQAEHFYSEQDIQPGRRRIETYALGLPSWTLLQEARYLARRLTAYDPDVIVVLTTSNDITDSYGVTGKGTLTTKFSAEHRDWGSAVFSNQQASRLGSLEPTALTTDLSPEARDRWRRGIGQLAELVELQHKRSKQILLSLLLYKMDGYFVHTYLDQLERAGVQAPVMMTNFFPSEATTLSHDGHPNRAGHSILASHLIHGLSALGWVAVPSAALPPLDERLSLDFEHPAKPDALERHRARYVREHLRTELDFRSFGPKDAKGVLGGLLLSKRPSTEAGVWASVRSAFLLRRDEKARTIEIEIAVPDRVELLPLELRLSLNGVPALTRSLGASESQFLRAPLPPATEQDPKVVEVLLEASSHFAGIGDQTMRSFRLLSVRLL
jgi:lysophospholipase L1-like esterase